MEGQTGTGAEQAHVKRNESVRTLYDETETVIVLCLVFAINRKVGLG